MWFCGMGGGCTPFTQINDTHLHAILARLLIRLENKVMHAERMDMHLNNRSGVASFRRADVVDVVMTAWKMVNHQAICEKGYEQTGPRLPLTGPIRRDQIYKDLRPVLDEIDPPIGLQEVGQKLRDDARAFGRRLAQSNLAFRSVRRRVLRCIHQRY